MIKIPYPSKDIIEKYYEAAKPYYLAFLRSTNSEEKYDTLRKYLDYKIVNGNQTVDENRLQNILVGKYDILKTVISKLSIVEKDADSSNLYKRFSNTDVGRSIANMLGLQTCPYCNRVPIPNIPNIKHAMDYDHFFPQSKYSYLSISLFNLIPCCHTCNGFKGADGKTLYPYIEEFGDDVYFHISFDKVNFYNSPDDFKINIVNKDFDSKFGITANKQIERLKLNIFYSNEKKRASETIKEIYAHECKVIDSYRNSFGSYRTMSDDDILDLVFKNHLKRNEWHKHEYSKFTYDIVKQFNVK